MASQPSPPNVDAKEYYGYLFGVDKSPTKVLNTLLTGIANYIVENVGNKEDKCLTPEKLALFYKSVGGNYDSLFVETTHSSISWIYASIGCQHTFQPTKDDFTPPSIPCLTEKGFVRWQSIEILLGPEEHVPYIQTAVREFNIKNPETGDKFPIGLPKEAFPLVPDPDIEKWHTSCAEKLRQRATPHEEEEGPAPELPQRPKVQTTYVHHVRPTPRPQPEPTGSNNPSPRTGYFDPSTHRPTRPIPYTHVSSQGARPLRPTLNRSPTHRTRQFLAPEEPYEPRIPRGRHRSFPNLSSPTAEDPHLHPSLHPEPNRRPYHAADPAHSAHPRRHSHPRHANQQPTVSEVSDSESDTSATSDSEADDPSPKSRSHPLKARAEHRRPQSAYVPRSAEGESGKGHRQRFFPSTAPNSASPSPVGEDRERQRDIDDKFRRGGYPIPIDLNGKLSAPFLMSRRKREAGSTEGVRREGSGSIRGGRERVQWRDLGDIAEMWRNGGARGEAMGLRGDAHGRASAGTSPVREPLGSRRHSRDERTDRERDRDRERERERERERDERDRDRRREKPRLQTRHSSHDEVPRRRDRDYDTSRSFRERDRERRAASPVRGVDGRKYPGVDIYR